ncbi:hypothetical protein [Hydrotalea sp.]|uniref:hypothetical protein n=1 Tax=Hydrotalea sp. TaxID=2881279 RepID=UPI00260A0D84|nr:hypothetical protein [Hydrotalea sp.]
MQQQTASSNYTAVKIPTVRVFNAIVWFNRLALAIVFIWFGYLKIIQVSPAEALVQHLHSITLVRYIPINTFLVLLGMVEVAVGILWLFPQLTKLAFICFGLHMFTTFLPLFYLTADTWQHAFVLTLTGQYIVKNIVLIASAFTIWFANSSTLKW